MFCDNCRKQSNYNEEVSRTQMEMSRMHLKFQSPSPLRTVAAEDKENQVPGCVDSCTPVLCHRAALKTINGSPRKFQALTPDLSSPKKCLFFSPDRLTSGHGRTYQYDSPDNFYSPDVTSISGTKLLSPEACFSPPKKNVYSESIRSVTKKIFSPCKSDSPRSPFKDITAVSTDLTTQLRSMIGSPKSPAKFTNLTKSPKLQFTRKLSSEENADSQDSGYISGSIDENMPTAFRFSKPNSAAPRRHSRSSEDDLVFAKTCSNCGDKDGFDSLLAMKQLDEENEMPTGFSNLLSAPLSAPVIEKENQENIPPPVGSAGRQSFRRCLSLVDTPVNKTSIYGSSLFTPADESSPLLTRPNLSVGGRAKRSETSLITVPSKRHKFTHNVDSSQCNTDSPTLPTTTATAVSNRRKIFQRCRSESDATIKSALFRASTSNTDLIGDYTIPFALPMSQGKHPDLKNITPSTLADLLTGEKGENINSYTIIDCRYPYEYNGGHIRGAKNMYTRDSIAALLPDKASENPPPKAPANGRNILIFHCEFSSERAPNLSGFLRNADRELNKDHYPALQYPEIYLLRGGYKDFFMEHPEHCTPEAYQIMLDPKHENDMRHFRAKSKSWSGDIKGIGATCGRNTGKPRTTFKRML